MTFLVPSRGRPDGILGFASTFKETTTADTHLIIILDEDDQFRDKYISKLRGYCDFMVAPPTRRGMVGALNWAFLRSDLGYAVGFMGDDHRPRTHGWDEHYLRSLRTLGSGFVYGNDLFQHERMPTQVAMTTDIPRELGWMSPPSLDHLCVDLVWLDLGQGIDRITYLPEVIVEHMHPLAGKARMDRDYRAVNNSMIAGHDSRAYSLYKQDDLPRDIERLRLALEV